jgi:hypothetical protein
VGGGFQFLRAVYPGGAFPVAAGAGPEGVDPLVWVALDPGAIPSGDGIKNPFPSLQQSHALHYDLAVSGHPIVFAQERGAG